MDIIEYFFKEPNREFHVREIAKLTKKSPTTTSKYLNNLKKQSLLLCEKKLNYLLFKANTENPLFRELKINYNLKKLRESGLIDYLNKSFNYPKAIILFGSFRKGENIPGSDIDIVLITPVKKEIDCSKYEKYLGYKIQLFLNSHEDIERMKLKNKELLNNFINGIIIEGIWEIF